MTQVVQDNILNVKQWCRGGTLAYGNTDHFYALTFALSDLPGTQESQFAAIYQQYRINRVTVRFVPFVTNVTYSDLIGTAPPMPVAHNSVVTTAVCYDDNVVPAAETELLEYQNCAMHNACGEPWEVSLNPKAKLDTSNVNSVPMTGLWLDTANLGVIHYGLKVSVRQTGGFSESIEGIYLYVRYDVSFRVIH